MLKKRIVTAACFLAALSMTGCGMSNSVAKINAPGVVAQTEIITEQRLAELGAVKKDTQTDTPVNNKLSSDYAYKDFVLTKAGKSNAVFSGEAFAAQLDILSELTGENKTADDETEVKNHLVLENTESVTRLNRVWVDDGVSFGGNETVRGLSYTVDMQSPSVVTERNEWLSDGTNGYITSLPVLFSEDAQADITSVLYFHDTWKTGAKPHDAKTRQFKNIDGISSEVTMIRDEGTEYYELKDANAYKMEFTNESYLMVVLPNDGVEVKDVDLSELMTAQAEPKTAHVRFYMPEIETESSYSLNLKDFGFQTVRIANESPDTIEENEGLTQRQAIRSSGITPSFTHIAKLSFTSFGACVSEGTEFIDIPDTYDDDLNVVNFICDKPFMYYIYDTENEEILFFGVVNKVGDKVAVETPVLETQAQNIMTDAETEIE